jgi:hypothetical protein
MAEEHRELRQALDRIEQVSDLTALIALLKDLYAQLEQHFAEEEAEDGLSQAIGDTSPQHVRRLEQLFDEHKGFLATTASIMDRAQALLDGPKAEIVRDAQHLTHVLRVHEEAETEIVMDSVYSDIGSGD